MNLQIYSACTTLPSAWRREMSVGTIVLLLYKGLLHSAEQMRARTHKRCTVRFQAGQLA